MEDKAEEPIQSFLLLCHKSLQSVPASLRTPAGAPATWKRSPQPEAEAAPAPAPAPGALAIPCQLHSDGLAHPEVGCPLGERLFGCSDWAGSREEETSGEGGKESLALAEGSGQMALLGLSKSSGEAGRALRAHRGGSSVRIHCRSILQVAGFKTKYF